MSGINKQDDGLTKEQKALIESVPLKGGVKKAVKWTLVPVEITDQMLVDVGPMDNYEDDTGTMDADHRKWWAAAVAEAPKPEATKEEIKSLAKKLAQSNGSKQWEKWRREARVALLHVGYRIPFEEGA